LAHRQPTAAFARVLPAAIGAAMSQLEYRQVDVFADTVLSGNGLAVVITDEPLPPPFMQRLTCELRQFETIFLVPGGDPDAWTARVFTMEEEVPFAGHPSLGAAAVLHERAGGESFECRLALPAGTIRLASVRTGTGFRVAMHQGPARFGEVIPQAEEDEWLAAFALGAADRDARMPLSVATTGLPYLVVPVTASGLERSRVAVADLEQRLASIGAKFAYVLDVENREGRTWDNLGLVEDIATGSAAGPVAGLLVRHGLAAIGETIVIRQGRFTGRPSEMNVEVAGSGNEISDIVLTGDVTMVARGLFDDSVTP
jgi:trans-2,3-dihydro-3-hydroxyanthranilate isomerase